MKWARGRGLPTVSIEWLAGCGYLWRQIDEASMPVDDKVAKTAPNKHLGLQSSTLPPPDLAAAAAKATAAS